MLWDTEEIGRVLGSQIYIYNSPEDIPAEPPRGVNDVFIDINLGKVYQWDGTEWKYKFPIPNDSRIVDIVDELTALGARLEDEESARVVAENARVGAEQSRSDAESIREGNEAARQSNETARQTAETVRASSETSRNDAESLREEAEGARQTAEANRAVAEGARSDAEQSRASAETARSTAETARTSAEQARVSAESARATAEGQRATVETARANAESARASAETARQTNESTRQSQEQTRQSQESARQTAEGARASAEQTRAQKEVARQVAESNREDAEALRVQAENTRAANDALWNEHEQTRQANEAQRVLAEQARVEAEIGRQAELDSKITYGSGWFDGSGGVHYSEESDLADNIKTNEGSSVVDAVARFDPISQAVEDGSYAKMDNMKGRSFAYNQLVLNGLPSDITSWTVYGASTITYENNSIHYVSSRAYDAAVPTLCTGVVEGHKYLVLLTVKNNSNSSIDIQYFINSSTFGSRYTVTAGDYKTYAQIATASASNTGQSLIYIGNITAVTDLNFKNVMLFDLTAMGISATTADEAIVALRSYGIEPTSYNEYSVGKIIDSKPNKIISRGVNLWDEEWASGSITDDGSIAITATIYGTSYNRCSPSTMYYSNVVLRLAYYDANKVFISRDTNAGLEHTAPINAYFFRPTMTVAYGSTYNHDITIAKGTTNPGYHAFVKDEHDLVLPVMRSAGSVADDKNNVNVGTFDGTQLAFVRLTEQGLNLYRITPTSIAKSDSFNMVNSFGIPVVNQFSSAIETEEKIQKPINDGTIYILLKTTRTLADFYVNYELANPVPQDPAISLPQNIKVWNGGSLETQYESPNTTPGLISLTYQANVKNFVVGMAKREDINWNPNNVVSQAQLQTGLAPKADVEKVENGEIKAGIAKSLATEVGRDDETPFSFTTVGIETDVETGFQELRKLVCVDVVRNQEYRWSSISTTYDNVTVSVENGKIKIVVSGERTRYVAVNFDGTIEKVSGHIYYYNFNESSNLTSLIGYNNAQGVYIAQSNPNGSGNFTPKGIYVSGTTGFATCTLIIGTNVTSGTYYLAPVFIDLTKKYGNNDVVNAILGTGTDAEKVARLLAFDPEILSDTDYDAGTLVPSKTAKLKMVDYNHFAGNSESNLQYIGHYYQQPSSSNYVISPNNNFNCYVVEVLSGRQIAMTTEAGVTLESTAIVAFLDKDMNVIGGDQSGYSQSVALFTTPINCKYIRFAISVSDTHNFSVFYYWDGSRIGYEPYQEHIYDMPNYEGHGILKVVDGKVVADGTELYPDGNSKKRYGKYTFTGNEVWQTFGQCYFVNNIIDPYAKHVENNEVPNCLSPIGQPVTINNLYACSVTSAYVARDNNIYISADLYENRASLVGKTIAYELATEEDIETAPFNGNPYMDDFGTMEFQDENGNTIPGLQGCELFYKANVAGFAESLYVKTDGDPDDLVTQEELAPRDAVDAQLKEALGGTLRNILVSKIVTGGGTLPLINTDWLDLGSVEWTLSGSRANQFKAQITISDGNNGTNIVSSMYESMYATLENITNMRMRYVGGSLYITNESYTDPVAFKAAMKGVLLAYEKA